MQPYTRLLLTVEPTRFVLRPSNGLVHSSDKADSGQALQILFKTQNDKAGEVEKTEKAEQELNGVKLLGHVEGQQHRVSFVNPASLSRALDAREYIIYGCIGLLDLHTGPHLIAITSVKELGEIEGKPVYAISKVAVLPMDVDGACQVLDKLAEKVNPSLEPTTQAEQDYEPKVSSAEATLGEAPKDDLPAPVATAKSPKVKFSLLSPKYDNSSPSSSPTPSLTSKSKDPNPGETVEPTPLKSKRISFELPRLGQGNRSNTNLASSAATKTEVVEAKGSPPFSPSGTPKASSSPAGFFAKLLDKKSRKSMEGTASPVPATGSSTDPVANTDIPSQDLTLSSTPPSAPKIDTSVPEADGNPAGPDAAPKSPSALAAAERFMIDSTKQIALWGEEAVSGLLKSPTAVQPEEKEHDGSASDVVVDNRIAEEELEKERILDRRIIREISSILSTGFYFATEFNLLSSKQKRSELSKDNGKVNAPLWQQVDIRFWWNEHLLREFLDIKANGYILPVMQGYVEVEQCMIEDQPFEFTLISRRSRERSGLRYQRRGIDEDGHTANFVETEQLLRIVRNDSDHQVSFVQTRGSIPLFWSQSPYRLKPIPVLERTEQENKEGFKKHVDSQLEHYGRQIFISLVEQHGREKIAGSAYAHYVEKLANPQVRYIQFDFHEQCKGMKYENIERLIRDLEGPILELGYCWMTPIADGSTKGGNSIEHLHEQKGVIRTNCMDCLDRTNVVQSAIGRYILNHQLLRLGIASFPEHGMSVYEEFENIFNNVWANNGDAISREYAGTSALKGDFTRTGKRNLQGMINDATNSMARMYQNTFKDYFRQAAIDYLLGSADMNVFKSLQTSSFGTAVVPDPILPQADTTPAPVSLSVVATENVTAGDLLPSTLPHSSTSSEPLSTAEESKALSKAQEDRALQDTWLKIREAAIETSAEIVISPGEEQWKGWTFICCTNEINNFLDSASSVSQRSSESNKPQRSSPLGAPTANKSRPGDIPVLYEEKVVLLTERAIYICTYDYEMEKVHEFWRLALEKLTGIDKGAFFLTAQDTSRQGQDPLENFGFAIVYRANSDGETLRVNRGSVRNRRKVGNGRTLAEDAFNLDRVLEVDEENSAAVESHQPLIGSSGTADACNDDPSAKGTSETEPNQSRSVRFKVVKHPETSMVPYATNSDAASTAHTSNPTRYRRTAQDCVEWVVTEIIQARCQLISLAEKEGAVGTSEKQPPQGDGKTLKVPMGGHGRSRSEEYNFQVPQGPRPSVQVDLVIHDRVLQSLEVAERLEKEALKREQERAKKSKKPFSAFFSSSKPTKESTAQPPATGASSAPSSNVSWLKRFQFGQDTDSDTEDEEVEAEYSIQAATAAAAAVARSDNAAGEEQPAKTSQEHTIDNRNRSVFEKFKQAVKNF